MALEERGVVVVPATKEATILLIGEAIVLPEAAVVILAPIGILPVGVVLAIILVIILALVRGVIGLVRVITVIGIIGGWRLIDDVDDLFGSALMEQTGQHVSHHHPASNAGGGLQGAPEEAPRA